MGPYYAHFGMQRDPFSDTADPYFYFETPGLQADARRILASVDESRGIVVSLGSAGTGKTSLCNHVEQTLLRDERAQIGKIADPAFSGEIEFLLAIARVFGMSLPPRSSAALRNALKNFLFDVAVLEERKAVLIIDEAQHLGPEGLETLRLLSNFEVPQRKLLSVLLFGQRELEPAIAARPNLHDRIQTWVRIEPLDSATAVALLDHRLARAGGPAAARLFTEEALAHAVAASGGLARRLCSIVRTALSEAAERGGERATDSHVSAALRASGFDRMPIPASPPAGTAPRAASGGGFFSRLFLRRSGA